MSKYTTELRFICETEAGYSENQGYKNVKNVLAQAAPKVFDFDFPIFDEQYRLPLEIKILRHYYTREICEETYGLWKLRLEDRLNNIMPYYNQLYKSELISFNPMYDVDVTRQHKRGNEGQTLSENIRSSVSTNTSNGTDDRFTTNDVTGNSQTDTTDKSVSEQIGSGTENANGTETATGTNESTMSGTGKITDAGDTSSNSSTFSDNRSKSTSNLTTAYHGNETRDGSTTQNITVNGTETGTVTGSEFTTADGNSSTKTSGTTGRNSTTDTTTDNNATSDTTTETTGSRWQLYSDTPQGGVVGLEEFNRDPASASSIEAQSVAVTMNEFEKAVLDGTVEGNAYLTNATKNTEQSKVTATGKTTGKSTGNSTTEDNTTVDQTVTGTSKDTGHRSSNTSTDITRNSTDSREGSTNDTMNWRRDGTETGSATGEVNAHTATTANGTANNTRNEETSSNGTETINRNTTTENQRTTKDTVNATSTDTGNSVTQTQENATEHSTSKRTVEGNGSMNANENGKSTVTSTEAYFELVQGKQGSGSFSKLLNEFRETFLNIDAMIIEELNDLFFGLWG